MKVIFLKDIKGIGRKYEEKIVADGFALNSLIPKKLAVPSTGAAAAQIKHLKDNEVKHKESENLKLEKEIEKIAGSEITFIANANEKGHLFASITPDKISQIIKDTKEIQIPSNFINSDPLKEVGSYKISLKILNGKDSQFILIIKAK